MHGIQSQSRRNDALFADRGFRVPRASGEGPISNMNQASSPRTVLETAARPPAAPYARPVIHLFGLQCPGCDRKFAARVGIEPTKMTRFYVPCLHCEYPIKGRMYGEELMDLRVEFDADQVNIEDNPLDAQFVTVDPSVPSRLKGAKRGQLGTFPTMTLIQLTGDDNGHELIQILHRGKDEASLRWPVIRRLFEYYLAEDWKHFDKAAADTYEDWNPVDTEHERATMANQAVGLFMAGVIGGRREAGAQFVHRLGKKHTAALHNKAYRDKLHVLAKTGEIRRLQRQVFDEIGRFVESLPSWQMGILDRYVTDEARPELASLTLFRDEFDILRDRYQQSYELVCKVIQIAVAAQNTVIRGDPNDFGRVPEGVGIKASPTTLAKFDKMSTAYRLAYLRQVPKWEGFADLMDNKKRNAIGHASSMHDLRTGRVTSDVDPNGVTYLDVCTDVAGMFEALAVSLTILRWARIATSQDFEFNQTIH
jgi:hypothetical protein